MDSADYPRVVIVTTSPLDGASATGRAIEHLFRGWPRQRLLQIAPELRDEWRPGIAGAELGEAGSASNTFSEVLRQIESFNPDLVYERATEWPEGWWDVGRVMSMHLNVPLIVHVFDDVAAWNELRFPGHIGQLRALRRRLELRRSLQHATAVTACSTAALQSLNLDPRTISEPFVTFMTPPDLAIPHERDHDGPFVIGYAGRCNSLQHAEGFVELLHAVQMLNTEMETIVRCVGPRGAEFEKIASDHPDLTSCFEYVGSFEHDTEIMAFLSGCDALAVTFNLSSKDASFVRYSISSKALDAAATDLPVIVIGSDELETVRWTADHGWADVARRREDIATTISSWASGHGPDDDQLAARAQLRLEWSERAVLGRFENFVRSTISSS